MKKIAIMLFAACAASGMLFEAQGATPIEAAATKMAEQVMTAAVDHGYITSVTKEEIVESGIVEEVAAAFVESDFDVPATVDKSAEAMVARGWFKDKAAAKRAMRRACEKARKNASLANKVYSFLGI